MYESQRLINQASTIGFIYIIRNPIDVMIANYHYHFLHVGTALNTTEEKYQNRFYNSYLNKGGDERWIEFEYGTWAENLDSWANKASSKVPNIVVRYEDMKRVPKIIAHTIASFLNLKKTDREITDALEFSSIGNMKKMEEDELTMKKETFFNREIPDMALGYEKGLRFINQGKVDRKHELPPDIRSRALNVFRGPMLKFGYF